MIPGINARKSTQNQLRLHHALLTCPPLAFDAIAKIAGAAPDELKLIFCFLVSYPLAALLKRIPDDKPQYKNLFIIAVSLFFFTGLFDLYDGLRTFLYSAAGTYAISRWIDGSLMPWLNFVYLVKISNLEHCSINS